MTDRLSSGLIELYRMLSVKPPITKDMSEVRLDVKDYHTNEQLINFLNGNSITKQSLEDKLPAKDDSLK